MNRFGQTVPEKIGSIHMYINTDKTNMYKDKNRMENIETQENMPCKFKNLELLKFNYILLKYVLYSMDYVRISNILI